MGDRFEESANRVEKILKTGDLDKAMKALHEEMDHESPESKRKILDDLKKQNEKDVAKNYAIPEVTITDEKGGFLGLGGPTGNVNVEFSQNAFKKAKQFVDSVNPFHKIGEALDEAVKKSS